MDLKQYIIERGHGEIKRLAKRSRVHYSTLHRASKGKPVTYPTACKISPATGGLVSIWELCAPGAPPAEMAETSSTAGETSQGAPPAAGATGSTPEIEKGASGGSAGYVQCPELSPGCDSAEPGTTWNDRGLVEPDGRPPALVGPERPAAAAGGDPYPDLHDATRARCSICNARATYFLARLADGGRLVKISWYCAEHRPARPVAPGPAPGPEAA